MAANPLVPQGTLNKLRGAVQVVSNPQLNVTAAYLGPAGISLTFEGEASGYMPTMTGAVPSPNPFQVATVAIHLLKTQFLSGAWKAQQELNTTIGDLVVVPDASTLPKYYLSNCTIKGVSELTFAGADPGYLVTVQGTYYINTALFAAQ